MNKYCKLYPESPVCRLASFLFHDYLHKNFTMLEMSLADTVTIKGFSGTAVTELPAPPNSVFEPTISIMLMMLGFHPPKSTTNEKFYLHWWRDVVFGFRRKKLIPDQWVKTIVKKGNLEGEWHIKTNPTLTTFQFMKVVTTPDG